MKWNRREAVELTEGGFRSDTHHLSFTPWQNASSTEQNQKGIEQIRIDLIATPRSNPVTFTASKVFQSV
jgi:hypothetical protein